MNVILVVMQEKMFINSATLNSEKGETYLCLKL